METSQRADVFKISLGAPGPSWTERAEKSNLELEQMEKDAREHIAFIFPENQFEAAVTEVQGKVTNNGIKSLSNVSDLEKESLGVEVIIKALGKPVRSKTTHGLTITRKISIQLKDARTKKTLATGDSLSIVGVSTNQNEEEAIANGDNQLIGALTDAVRNLAPGLVKEE
jgi:hypothetical protein